MSASTLHNMFFLTNIYSFIQNEYFGNVDVLLCATNTSPHTLGTLTFNGVFFPMKYFVYLVTLAHL